MCAENGHHISSPPLGVYSLKTAPLLRLLLLRLASPVPCSVEYYKLTSLLNSIVLSTLSSQGTEASPSQSPLHLTSAFLCVCLSFCIPLTP